MNIKDPNGKSAKNRTHLDLTLDQLYAAVWVDQISGKADLRSLDYPPDAIKRGRELVNGLEESLRASICQEWDYCRRSEDPLWRDRVALLTALTDVVSGLALRVSPMTLAAILIKRGLDAFCECHKKGASAPENGHTPERTS